MPQAARSWLKVGLTRTSSSSIASAALSIASLGMIAPPSPTNSATKGIETASGSGNRPSFVATYSIIWAARVPAATPP
jgi:hypothetical protein